MLAELVFEIERFWKSIVTPVLPPINAFPSTLRYVKSKPQNKSHNEPAHFLEAIIGFRLANVKKEQKLVIPNLAANCLVLSFPFFVVFIA